MTYQPAYHLTSVCFPMTACSTEQYIRNKMPSSSKKIWTCYNSGKLNGLCLPGKGEVLRVTSKHKHIIHTHYKIHGMILDTVDKTKYLGVTIQSKLNWKPHNYIHNITKKASSVRAFLQRNLSNCHRPVNEQAYKTYVRPILEYSSTVWDPHTKELTSQHEMVQRRAAICVTADYRRRHSVTLLLNQLQWQTLLQRRTHSKVTMLYRIHHQLVAIPASPPYII